MSETVVSAASVDVARSSDVASCAEGWMATVVAFLIWGFFPLYLKPLQGVESFQIIAHRVVWGCALVFVWLFFRGDLANLRHLLRTPAVLGRLTLSAVLISANWLLYVWGVTHGHVVEGSLGYFINPLVNVLLGVAVLRERLSVAQWASVAIAVLAVVYLGVVAGTPPWLSLSIAVSFSLYGFIRKIVHVEALQGLAVETLILVPVAIGYLLWCEAAGGGVFGHGSLEVSAFLIGAGPVTAVPLFLFAFGARRIPYSTVGVLMYIAPSLQLLVGIFLYHEPFPATRAVGFAMIWLALVIYVGEGLWRARKERAGRPLDV
ncbi:MAG TPA: EamA family transporter RarD [Steroidobacteraceae bacterium]|nr:EamA family transporter RarD [Steroidobacteraceae bacterium]